MKILMAHNHYLERGGEDQSAAAEIALLRQNGHEVVFYELDNQKIAGMSALQVGLQTIWSQETYREIRKLLKGAQFDVVHIQNFFPLISPSLHYAAQVENVPVVQAIRNYRLMCLNAYFFRDGHPCEDCAAHFIPYPGILHRCYHNSVPASTVVASMLMVHRLLGTWQKQVDLFVTLTDFARSKLVLAGLPAERIVVKPNFVPDARMEEKPREYALFVGRLSPEKGIMTLLQAWEQLPGRFPLKVVGTGPSAEAVTARVNSIPAVELLGERPHAEVMRLMQGAKFVVFPSEWYETFGRISIESFSCETPVISSKIGAIQEIVQDGQTGLHFRPGDATDLAEKVTWAWEHPAELAVMGQKARIEYESRYTPEKNYQMLMDIYVRAIEQHGEQG
jgi:glycosyltransferase involved in cell wall biosynthesis